MPGTHRDQKKVLDAPDLELWIVVSHHVGSGNNNMVCCKSNKCS